MSKREKIYTDDDIERLRPLHRNVIVHKYFQPERVGSIILADSWAEDSSFTLYEVVKAAAGVEEELGFKLEKGDIVRTEFFHMGIYIGTYIPSNARGRGLPESCDLWILAAVEEEIAQVIKKDW